MKKLFTTSILLGCLIFYATAQIIHVPGDHPSIQAGINAATDGDTVLVADSTYYENINFNGMAITVASHFLMDDDTSHISKTIIDGSQSANPDTASVVTMGSGEDTTSVLCGFTITGGKGTYMLFDGHLFLHGGGLNIYNSGGKIEHNIIEDNHLTEPIETLGCGIGAFVNNNHTAIIRNNLVRNNTYNGNSGGQGCGMFLGGGRFIIEGNTISGNITNSPTNAIGGGICYYRDIEEGVIPEVTIINNIITGNESYSTSFSSGAGIFLRGNYQILELQIYNNLIYNNHAHDGWGGGIAMWEIQQAVIFNNTIVNNKAELGGKQLELEYGTKVILFNNILWSDTDDSISEINLKPNQNNVLIAEYNIIRVYPHQTGRSNINYDPMLTEDSFELSEGSPGIGNGVDSIEIEGTWYYAPSFDYYGNARPHPIDDRVDIGAVESPYEGFVYISDTAFLYALIDEGVDTSGDNLISYTEAEAVTKLNVRSRDISDLTGIEAFVNLDTLDCSQNQLTSLDVSNNTALGRLDCYINQLPSLDVSNNTDLNDLSCHSNQLTSLDVSGCNTLIALDCNNNQLTSLDVSNNTALTELECRENQLTSLDVSNNTALTELWCSSNQLTSLDVSNNTALEDLVCWGNPLISLDVSNNTALTELWCSSNQLTSLDISNNAALLSLGCSSNQLTSLDVSNNTALTELSCGGNDLTSLDVSNNTALKGLGCSDNQLTSLNISKNIELLTGFAMPGGLGLSNMPTLYEVCVWEIPFPPPDRNGSVDTTGSPNVYFTTECSDFEPPYIVAADTLYQPDYIEATSTEDGMIYLVHENTDDNLDSIRATSIDSVSAIANIAVNISLEGQDNGIYWLYATDLAGNISEREAFTIMGVGIDNALADQVRIYPNPTNDILTIVTGNIGQHSIKITSLNGQLIFSGEMEGSFHQIDLSSFQIGLYFVRVKSRDYVRTEKIIKL